MKKIFLMFFVAAFMSLASEKAFAQYEKGDKLLNVGIGLGTYGLFGSGIPINASGEYGFSDKISGGIYLAFVSTNYLGGDWKYSYVYAGPRASYHFNELFNISNDKFDIYGGAGLYVRNYSAKWKGAGSYLDNYKTSYTDIIPALHAGARYYFKPTFGGWAEVGYGASPLQLGVTFKF
ncbi:hypothetical protein FEM33_11390 [Dyadobacter flavalbus]|uniref:Porin family protein n=1 Tax=Dyadobacter flavalbus TaxID=2579942 RepID=A0A5M8QTL8_9BACT|nr:hypothetical protein [Dyadobacter flavalbus]KAA6439615.1 hypothetical protein FEM33_11390 [Dyadobacter flavalbus]